MQSYKEGPIRLRWALDATDISNLFLGSDTRKYSYRIFDSSINDLEILSADIGNAYLQALAREQVHTTAGPEFGPTRQGQTVIIVRAMYGLKSSGAAWHTQLSETLYCMDFKPSLADPDVWYRPAIRGNGIEYWVPPETRINLYIFIRV